MKALLIDPAIRTVAEIYFDGNSVDALHELLGGGSLQSAVFRPNEVMLWADAIHPQGFLMPLPNRNIHVWNRAILMGSVGGHCADTQLTAAHVARGLFWTGTQPGEIKEATTTHLA